jgi:alanine racemase
MSGQGRPTVAAIDANALRANFATIRAAVGPAVRVLAVVKADGYGHGARLVAPVLAAAGADWFGVATVGEAVELRESGITQPILVLAGAAPGDVDTLIDHRLSVALLAAGHARELAAALRRRSLPVHVKVDTGMSRLGVPPAALGELLAVLRPESGLVVEGVFSHLADADDCRTEFGTLQLRLFGDGVERMREAGREARWQHLANSVATLTRPDMHYNLVRPGIALYGVAPAAAAAARLRPVMRLHTRPWQLKSVPVGCAVSYGQTFVTRRPTRIAVLPIGYADGYGRALSNRGAVLIRGRRAPIIGRVCMDLTLVDVTDIPMVTADDEVVLWGRQGDDELRVAEVAAWQDTIAYEVLTRLGKRVPRTLINGDGA